MFEHILIKTIHLITQKVGRKTDKTGSEIMHLTKEDKELLGELCLQHGVSFEKIEKLLSTVREYELKDKRRGIYDALKDILKNDLNRTEA